MCIRWMAWKGRRLTLIELLILLHLKKNPLYGYEIIKKLKTEFKDVWEPKTGTIYPALKRLESKGLIASEIKDDKEYYHITKLGEKVLEESYGDIEESLDLMERFFLNMFIHMPLRPKLLRIAAITRIPPVDMQNLSLTDKKMALNVLRNVRNILKTRLRIVEDQIKELEEELGEKNG